MQQNQGNQNGPEFTSSGFGNNGEPWKPQAQPPAFYFNPSDPNNVKMGFFRSEEHIPTPQFGPQSVMTLYVIHLCDGAGNLGPIINVAGSTSLKKQMADYQLNSFVQITYCGPKLKKDVPQNTPFYGNNFFHVWKAGIWGQCPFNYKDLLARAGGAAAFATQQSAPAVNTAPQYQSQQPVYNQPPAQNYQPPAQQNTYQQPVQQPYVQQQSPPAQMPQHYQDRVQQQPPQQWQQPVQQPAQQQPPVQQQNTAPNLPPAPSFMQNQQPPAQQPPAFGQNIQNPFTQQLNNDAAQQYNQDIKY